ncbi:MAG TPA: TVP38/TMEM64 family protein [Syntrophorhabdaceae bacterium]|jgi:uncharacterized membrane protein YdjX (TVP38/TMEM64 family)
MAMTGAQKKIILLALLVAAAAAIKISGVSDYLTFENLRTHRDLILSYVQARPVAAPFAYILAYAVATALSIPGAVVLTLAGGFLFGVIPAAIYVNIGATVGAAAAFLVTKYILGDWLQKRYEKQLRKFNEEMTARGRNYLLTIRLIPVFPFFLINILAGLTRIPLSTFIWTTSVGILPGDFVYSYAGSRLALLNSARDVFSPQILSAFALLALLSILPVIISFFTRHRRRGKEGNGSPGSPQT